MTEDDQQEQRDGCDPEDARGRLFKRRNGEWKNEVENSLH